MCGVKENARFASASQSSCDASGQNNNIQDNAHSRVALIRRQSLSITAPFSFLVIPGMPLMPAYVVKTPGSDCSLDQNVPPRQQLLVLIGKSQSSEMSNLVVLAFSLDGKA